MRRESGGEKKGIGWGLAGFRDRLEDTRGRREWKIEKSETRVLPPYQAENMLCIISPQKKKKTPFGNTFIYSAFDRAVLLRQPERLQCGRDSCESASDRKRI